MEDMRGWVLGQRPTAGYGGGNGVEAKADRCSRCELSTLKSVLGNYLAAVVDGE
jgi:hypothetical protein